MEISESPAISGDILSRLGPPVHHSSSYSTRDRRGRGRGRGSDRGRRTGTKEDLDMELDAMSTSANRTIVAYDDA